MMEKPLVSILIPCYNASMYLSSALDSIVHQSYDKIETILVDDGSSDESLYEAMLYKNKIKLKIIQQSNQGACTARNRAFKESKGMYIQYLDADDMLSKDKIASQIELVSTWGEDYVYSCRWDRFVHQPDEANFPIRLLDRDYNSPLNWFQDAYSNNEMVQTSSWLVSRKLIEKAGEWNTNLSISQDGEFFARVLTYAKGIKFSKIGKVYYRSNINSSISSKYHTVEGIKSNFLAISLIDRNLNKKFDRTDIGRLIANRYQAFIYKTFPRNMELIKQADKRIKELGGHTLKPEIKGRSKWVSTLFGWKFVSIIKYILNL